MAVKVSEALSNLRGSATFPSLSPGPRGLTPRPGPSTPTPTTTSGCTCEGAGWLWDRVNRRMVECDCGIVAGLRKAAMKGASGWTEAMQRMTFANLVTLDGENGKRLSAARQGARRFAKNPKGWLVLAGTWGDGKSHLLAAIANAQPPARTWLYAIARDLWAWLGCVANWDPEADYEARLRLVQEVPLLLVDELGAERSSEAVRERRQRLFDARYRGELPTAFATNAWPLDSLYGGPDGGWEDGWLVSRLRDRRFSQVYPMPDGDFRLAG